MWRVSPNNSAALLLLPRALQRLADEFLLDRLQIDSFCRKRYSALRRQFRCHLHLLWKMDAINRAITSELCGAEDDAAEFGHILRPAIVIEQLCRLRADRSLAGKMTCEQQDVTRSLAEGRHV